MLKVTRRKAIEHMIVGGASYVAALFWLNRQEFAQALAAIRTGQREPVPAPGGAA